MHMCLLSLRVRTDGPNNSGLTARVAQMRGEQASQCTARSAAQPSRLPNYCDRARHLRDPWLRGPHCLRIGPAPQGLRAACGATCGSAQRKCPTNQRPVPHRRTNMTCRRAGEKRCCQTRARCAREAVLIMGICGSPAGVLDSKRTVHLLPGPSNACSTCSGTPVGGGQREQKQ